MDEWAKEKLVDKVVIKKEDINWMECEGKRTFLYRYTTAFDFYVYIDEVNRVILFR